MSASADAVRTASNVIGAASAGTAFSYSWLTEFPWSDVAIIISCVGGLFFMIERFYSFKIKRIEYLDKLKDREGK